MPQDEPRRLKMDLPKLTRAQAVRFSARCLDSRDVFPITRPCARLANQSELKGAHGCLFMSVITQSIKQSTNQPINLSTYQSINQSIKQPINQSINQSVSQSVNQSINKSMDQSINRSISHSATKSINPSTNTSIDHSINQSINQLTIMIPLSYSTGTVTGFAEGTWIYLYIYIHVCMCMVLFFLLFFWLRIGIHRVKE